MNDISDNYDIKCIRNLNGLIYSASDGKWLGYQMWFTLGVKVCKIDSEIYGLVEQPWLQLMYYAIYLPCGHNFR